MCGLFSIIQIGDNISKIGLGLSHWTGPPNGGNGPQGSAIWENIVEFLDNLGPPIPR